MKTLKHKCHLEVFSLKLNNTMDSLYIIPSYGQSTDISSTIKVPLENTARQLVNGHSIRCLEEIKRSFGILEK